MALTTTQSNSLTGESKIDGVLAVRMNAKLTEDGNNSNTVTTIVDKALYNANKEACRADIDAFTAYVREVEDNQITV